ncbi:hypothetical protein MNBD_GAMMA10-3043 [hydrothermal vent metagenome]|uniref:Uncharacterized protein n=1 Tax=hydrothermal vent metagenome TaxID=652676 RepID=A0A3B0XUK8_9ZZZZ
MAGFSSIFRGCFFELNFDKTEISNAFSQLDKVNRPIQFVLHIEEIETATATLKVSLVNGRESIELKKIAYKYTDSVYRHNSDEQIAILLAKSKLKVEYKRALNNSRYLQNFIDASTSVAENIACAKEYSYKLADYTIRLVLTYIETVDYVSAKSCVYHYTNIIFPLSGAHEMLDDIVSDGLFLALTDKDDDLLALIFGKLLGKEYDLTLTKNNIFLFNLACCYALKKDKVRMLQAIKQSLLHGMKSERFMSESYLKDYWDDVDFIAVFNN